MSTTSSQRMLLATPLLVVQAAAVLVLDDWRACPGCPTAAAVQAAAFGDGFVVTLALVALPVLVLVGICAALFCVGWRRPSVPRVMESTASRSAPGVVPSLITKGELAVLEMQDARQSAVWLMQRRVAAALGGDEASARGSCAREAPEGREGCEGQEGRALARGTGPLEVPSREAMGRPVVMPLRESTATRASKEGAPFEELARVGATGASATGRCSVVAIAPRRGR